jgi:ABC-type dipeptide/oligopeptide/nickel transport system permease subunit
MTWGSLRLVAAAVPLVVTVLAAAFAPTLAPHDPLAQGLDRRLLPPSWLSGGSSAYLLGTDQIGRDVFSRIIYGARISLPIALAASALGAGVGIPLGAIAGYFRGGADGILSNAMDIQLSFPFLLFAVSIIAVSGPGVSVLVVVLAIGSWVAYARIVRGMVLSLREKEFVQAARALGVSSGRIIARQIVPNVLPTALVVGTLDVGRIIILEATLSFLGLGVQPPTPSWGMSLSDAREYIQIAWWTATFPGLAIMLVVLSVNQLGDGLRDILDPRLRLA